MNNDFHITKECKLCRTREEGLNKCSKCRSVWYCCKNHQMSYDKITSSLNTYCRRSTGCWNLHQPGLAPATKSLD